MLPLRKHFPLAIAAFLALLGVSACPWIWAQSPPAKESLSENEQHALEVGLQDPYWLTLPNFAKSGAQYLVEPEQSQAIEKAIELGLQGDLERARHMLQVIGQFRRAHRPHSGLNSELLDEESFSESLTRSSQRWTDAFLSFIPASGHEQESFDQYSLLLGERRRATKAIFRTYQTLRTGQATIAMDWSYRKRLAQRQEVARRLWSGRDEHSPESTQQLLQEIRTSLRQDARELVAATDDALQAAHHQSLGELVQLLPANISILDVVRYHRLSNHDPGGQRKPPEDYCVFVVTPGKWPVTRPRPDPVTGIRRGRAVAVHRVELGPCDPIDRAIRAWRKAIAEGSLAASESERVAQLVWQPISGYVPKASKYLYVVPDGNLADLPWMALPVANNQPLLVTRHVAFLPFTEFLSHRLQLSAATAPGERPSSSALAIGVTEHSQTWLQEIRKLSSGRWRQLDARSAEPKRVLAELPSASHVHVTAHGHFGRAALEHARRTVLPGPLSNQDALLFSCLYLAPSFDGDPIEKHVLTADTLSEINLSRMELAVLAACETAIGEARVGEGMFSLPRAFHLAGCQDVVSTLWPVDETATEELLSHFYQHLWQEKKNPVEALREAQLAIYRSGRRSGAEKLGPVKQAQRRAAAQGRDLAPKPMPRSRRSPPLYWAGFMLSGLGAAPETLDPVLQDLRSDFTDNERHAVQDSAPKSASYGPRQRGAVLASRDLALTSKKGEQEILIALAARLSAAYELDGKQQSFPRIVLPPQTTGSLLSDCPELVPSAELELAALRESSLRRIGRTTASLVLARVTAASISEHGYSSVAYHLRECGYDPTEIPGVSAMLLRDQKRRSIARAIRQGEVMEVESEADFSVLFEAAASTHDQQAKKDHGHLLEKNCDILSAQPLRELMQAVSQKLGKLPKSQVVTLEAQDAETGSVRLVLKSPETLENLAILLARAPRGATPDEILMNPPALTLGIFVPEWKSGQVLSIPFQAHVSYTYNDNIADVPGSISCQWYCGGRNATFEIPQNQTVHISHPREPRR